MLAFIVPESVELEVAEPASEVSVASKLPVETELPLAADTAASLQPSAVS